MADRVLELQTNTNAGAVSDPCVGSALPELVVLAAAKRFANRGLRQSAARHHWKLPEERCGPWSIQFETIVNIPTFPVGVDLLRIH